MESNLRKKWLIALSVVLACLILSLGLICLGKQRQKEKRKAEVRAEETYYAESLLKYSRILFGPPIAPEPQPEKKEVIAEKIQPETHLKQPEPPKVVVVEKPDIYQRIETLVKTRKSSPGYIKGLAMLFYNSDEICNVLVARSNKAFSEAFFLEKTKALFTNYSYDSKGNSGLSGLAPEEKSLRQEILRITDGKVIAAYKKLLPALRDDKAKAGFVRYLAAYILTSRNQFQVAAEIDIFFNQIPAESFLPVLLGLIAETRGYQSEISLCQEIINYSPKSLAAAVALESAGDIYRQMKMNADAINIYKKIVLEHSEYPAAVKAQEKIIDIYATDWKVYPNAIYECFELVRLFPKSTEAIHAQFMAGKFYYLANNYDQAIVALQNFVSKYSKTEWAPEAYLLMALNYLGKQENDLAIKQLRTMIRKYPKHELASRAQFLVGYCFLSTQKYYDALREYQKLVINYPASPYAERAKQFVERLSKMKKR